MSTLSAAEVVEQFVRPGDTIVIAQGLGEPPDLVRALADQASRLTGCRILSGLLLGDYPFLSHVGTHFRYDTWHVTGPLREACRSGRVGFLPLRGSRVIDVLHEIGVDVLLCTVSPGRDGVHSFGASVSYPYAVAEFARDVIGEEHALVPFTRGVTTRPADAFTAVVHSDTPLRSFRDSIPTDDVRRIAEFVCSLIPDRATLQVGLGVVAEAVLAAISERGGPVLSGLWGLGTDAAATVMEAGLVQPDEPGTVALVAGELMGGERLLRLANDNPAIELRPSPQVLAPSVMAAIPRLISVNTALQVDVDGNVNCDVLDGEQVAGVAGAVDFVEGATLSPRGRSIIAITSTVGSARRSRIVATLDRGAVPVTARHSVQFVVTEYGIADLRAKNLTERRDALVSIAHPDHRDVLLLELKERYA